MTVAKSLLLFTFGAALGSVPALAQQTDSPPVKKAPGKSATERSPGADPVKSSDASKVASGDRKIMEKMARAGIAEVETGKVAAGKAQAPEVRQFAQHMVDEHGKGNKELQQLAQNKGVKLPAEPDSDHRDKLKDLNAMSGDKFDKRYIEQAGVKDHKSALKLFEEAAKDAKDPELKSFAQKNVPHIKEHLQMAQKIADSKKEPKKSAKN